MRHHRDSEGHWNETPVITPLIPVQTMDDLTNEDSTVASTNDNSTEALTDEDAAMALTEDDVAVALTKDDITEDDLSISLSFPSHSPLPTQTTPDQFEVSPSPAHCVSSMHPLACCPLPVYLPALQMQTCPPALQKQV